MSVWPWIVLQFAAQSFFGIVHWRLVGKGRLLSRPLWRFRLFRPPVSRLTGRPLYSSVRLRQVVALGLVEVYVAVATGSRYVSLVGAVLVVALYLDDYFTGDDDRWRRFRGRVRNAVRWRMRLPAAAQEGAR